MARAISLARSLAFPSLAKNLADDSGTLPSSFYLRDTFTDTNGTALTSHVMDVGPGWTNDGAFFDIQSNATREQFGTPGAVFSNGGVPNGVIRVTVSAAGAQIALRVTDAGNMIVAQNPNNAQLTLTKREAAADTVIQNASGLTAITYPAQFQITLSGNSITMQVVGQAGQSVAGSDAFNNTATSFGFRALTALITYDDFSFQSS